MHARCKSIAGAGAVLADSWSDKKRLHSKCSGFSGEILMKKLCQLPNMRKM
jgi:hypothetical protein